MCELALVLSELENTRLPREPMVLVFQAKTPYFETKYQSFGYICIKIGQIEVQYMVFSDNFYAQIWCFRPLVFSASENTINRFLGSHTLHIVPASLNPVIEVVIFASTI